MILCFIPFLKDSTYAAFSGRSLGSLKPVPLPWAISFGHNVYGGITLSANHSIFTLSK